MSETNTKLSGVKGWLLLLCLLLTVFDPFVVLASLFVFSGGAKDSYDLHPEVFRVILVSGVVGIGLAVFSMYSGLSLWRVAPRAVAVARRYLVTVGLSSVFLLFLPVLLGASRDPGGMVAQESILNTLFTLCYAAVWYAYLARSKRVRITYREKGDKEREE